MIWFQRDAWHTPAVFLAGLLAVRGVLLLDVPPAYHQLMIGAIWLAAAYVVARFGHVWPATFLTLSGASYAVLLIFGHYIKFLGFAPIIADGFWIAAFAALAFGGGGGKPVDFGASGHSGIDPRPVASQALVASRETNRDNGV